MKQRIIKRPVDDYEDVLSTDELNQLQINSRIQPVVILDPDGKLKSFLDGSGYQRTDLHNGAPYNSGKIAGDATYNLGTQAQWLITSVPIQNSSGGALAYQLTINGEEASGEISIGAGAWGNLIEGGPISAIGGAVLGNTIAAAGDFWVIHAYPIK